ncbi:MAG: AAA family ATPase [Bacteroidales bacterium]|nr:AAA family ATPase [Bacteroidales bacterium]
MDLKEIAKQIREAKESIFLIYAFNGIGKTRLSIQYKEDAREQQPDENGKRKQTGVYYNAYSEDLFVWDNDIEHSEENIKLRIVPSSLNESHSLIYEDDVRQKLKPYNPKYDFVFHSYEDDPSKGIEFISFHLDDKDEKSIKLSRGEERIFVWCFFLALIDSEGWADKQNQYIFIDDPVSSLDDHNIFVTAFTLFELIKKHYETRKIIITTHHIGFATILGNWLTDPSNPFRGNKGNNKYQLRGLSLNKGDYSFVSFADKAVWLYHLRMLQVLDKAIQDDADENSENGIEVYHMAILRQILENISSFLGVGRISFVLEQIGYSKEEADRIALEDNALTHRNVYFPQSDIMVPDNKNLLKDVFNRIIEKYHFDYKRMQ